MKKRFKKLAKIIGEIFLALLFIVFISLIMAVPTFFLWNWLMPAIFKVATVNFWQAWGFNCLTGILLKNPKEFR